MEYNLKQISNLIENQDNLEDEKEFKLASVSLVCYIVNINENHKKEYAHLFKKDLNLQEDELLNIQKKILTNRLNINKKIHYIKKELNNNIYQIMLFLKILNKFAIIDGCNQESYQEFENIRDEFLKEYY